MSIVASDVGGYLDYLLLNKHDSFRGDVVLNLKFRSYSETEELISPVRRDPQLVYPMHSHDFTELVIVLSGKGNHVTTQGICELKKGDVFVIPDQEVHGYKKCDNLVLFNIMFRKEILAANLGELTAIMGFQALFHIEPQFRKISQQVGYLELKKHQMEYVSSVMNEIEAEYEIKNVAYRTKIQSLFLNLLVYLCRCYSVKKDRSSSDFISISSVIGYLQCHLNQPVSIDELLSLSGLSNSSLYRLMKKMTGYGPIDYHLKIRIQSAAEDLQQTDRSVTDVAGNYGFEDPNYFTRQFGKIMGQSPTKFRKQKKRGID